MSVAALEALTLRRHLARGSEPQPDRWFRDLARLVDIPWQMAAGGDLIFPGVEGRRTRKIRLMSTYIARLHAAASTMPTLPPRLFASPDWSRRPNRCCTPPSPCAYFRRQQPTAPADGRLRRMPVGAMSHRRDS